MQTPQGAQGAPLIMDADGNVEPHETRLVVWDTPPAIERGTRFAVRLGVACSARCPAGGWAVEVRGHDGESRATATLGDEPWPGTDALYHAEVALTAPDAEGLYTWEAEALTDGADVAHAGGSARFRVRVVSPPACLLTVVAVDAESGTPVAGARVAAHPYRAVTDARGVAEMRVARSTLDLPDPLSPRITCQPARGSGSLRRGS